MDLQPAGHNNKKLITAFAVLLAVVIVAGLISFTAKNSSAETVNQAAADTTSASSDSTTTATPTEATTASTSYKDGSYTASGRYLSPGGQEEITVNITLQNSTVTATSVQQVANNEDSASFQARFKQNYQSLVVGKNIADIHLSRVSGSSLTSGGFNQALEQIKSQAQR